MILAATKEGGYMEDSVASAGKGFKCKTPIFYLCYSDVSQQAHISCYAYSFKQNMSYCFLSMKQQP